MMQWRDDASVLRSSRPPLPRSNGALLPFELRGGKNGAFLPLRELTPTFIVRFFLPFQRDRVPVRRRFCLANVRRRPLDRMEDGLEVPSRGVA